MKETVKTRPSREYGVLQHSAILWTRTERQRHKCIFLVTISIKNTFMKTATITDEL